MEMKGPVWQIQLWAAKPKKLEVQADIRVMVLSATDSAVFKADLRQDKADPALVCRRLAV